MSSSTRPTTLTKQTTKRTTVRRSKTVVVAEITALTQQQQSRWKIPSSDWPVQMMKPPTNNDKNKNSHDKDRYDNDDDDDEDQRRDESESSEQQLVPPRRFALRPGSLLQTCSGQDILLSKTAVLQTPNIIKEKGKVLFILPGWFSLKQSALVSSSTTMTTASTEQPTQETDQQDQTDQPQPQPLEHIVMETDNDNNNNKDETAVITSERTNTASSTNTNTTEKQEAPILGRLEQLSSDAPLLKVPFPNNRVLVFPGTKISTTTKFMMLTCSSRKKGSVQCKVNKYGSIHRLSKKGYFR